MSQTRPSDATDEPYGQNPPSGMRRAGAMDPWDRLRTTTATPFDERVARSSPFPAIADYAFLSLIHI